MKKVAKRCHDARLLIPIDASRGERVDWRVKSDSQKDEKKSHEDSRRYAFYRTLNLLLTGG